ncbi:hypothetical protein [Peredibacter starrii]|uniref:DUF4189 domain-containing protein n=1 Tax=Peredibacter starrii TaxID=28202 RepID=A0AAX4HV92_9BACT|nr:hypothetical protein [Peredibacter starrii]WPU67077.1 hypothetical protein SOO65_09960 [Peredibacter starrii]
MKSIILLGLLFSSIGFANTKTVALGFQCRADGADGTVAFATHMNRYTSEAMALQQCQASSRRPGTCRIVSCL